MRLFYTTLFLWVCLFEIYAANLPDGFIEQKVAEGLDPTTMTQLPDGRILIAEKYGAIRVVENGQLLAEPLHLIDLDNKNERGLLGLAVDPDFVDNGFLYYYHTLPDGSQNQAVRITVSGNKAVQGSEQVIFELDQLTSSSGIHNGGAMAFGIDGKLYIAVGDGGGGQNGQSLNTTFGKILRINADGSIPSDNPFYDLLDGKNRAIWAYGLRNPFTFAIQPGTGLFYANDVGGSKFEEINEIKKGKNYGWKVYQGIRNNGNLENYVNPVLAYPHSEGCSIIGASFYNPENYQFPQKYHDKYFFGDYCDGYIKVFDPATHQIIETFATNIERPVAILTAQDGSMYYLERRGIPGGSVKANTKSNNGVLFQITYAEDQDPVISEQPNSITVSEGADASFFIRVSGANSETYQWYKDNFPIEGAIESTLIYPNVTVDDDGSEFYCVITHSTGTLTSNVVTLTVTTNQPPVVNILDPVDQAFYEAGDILNFQGAIIDPEDGPIDASKWTWQIDFHHAEHVHPGLAPTSNIKSGEYLIPSIGHNATDVWYRIYLTGEDNNGAVSREYVEIFPKLIDINITSEPEGVGLFLEGKQEITPHSFESVVGIVRTLTTPENIERDGRTYTFKGWENISDEPFIVFRADEDHKSIKAIFDLVPIIIDQPQSLTVNNGEKANFSITTDPVAEEYQWYRNGIAIPGANASTYSIEAVSPEEQGAFYCEAKLGDFVLVSDTATLSVITRYPPAAAIIYPKNNDLYHAGDTLYFKGRVEDTEDGTINAEHWTWAMELFVDGRREKAMNPINGQEESFYIIPRKPILADQVWYRLSLTATDSDGMSTTQSVEIFPERVQFSIDTDPKGLSLSINDKSVSALYSFSSIIGTEHIVSIAPIQTLEESLFQFNQWDFGATDPEQVVQVPAIPDTIVARFSSLEYSSGSGLMGYYYKGMTGLQEDSLLFNRIDPIVDFDWSLEDPLQVPNQGDPFSVIWVGYIEPLVDGLHSFILEADDGARLSIDEQLIIDQWGTSDTTSFEGSVQLMAGKRYPIKIMYYQNTGDAHCQLKWYTDQLPEQIVPYQQLFPGQLSTTTWEELNTIDFEVFPVPTVDQLNVTIEYPNSVSIQFNLVEGSGKIIRTWQVEHQAGKSNFQLSIGEESPAGVYFLEAVTPAFKTSRTIIKN